jgi:type I restriction enzyme S subunit
MKPTDAMQHPPDWSVTTVGKAIEIRRGVSWGKNQEHNAPRDDTVAVLRISNVQKTLETDDVLHLSGVPEKAKRLKRAGKNWTIIVGSNGNRERIGNSVFIDQDMDYLFASFLLAAKPRTDSGVLPKFFFRWLAKHEVQARITASAEGSTGLSNLAHDFFRKMEIAYPPASEQAAIARVLDAADAAIARTRTAIDKAQRLKKAVVREAFARCGASRSKLGDFVSDICYGTSRASNDKGWGFPTLRIPNIIGGQVNIANLTSVVVPEHEAKAYELQDGDLLMVRTNGNPGYLGRSAVFRRPDDRRWMYASYLIRVRLRRDLNPFFVDEFLKTTEGRRQLFRKATTSAGNHNINTKSIRSILVPADVSATRQQHVIDVAQAAQSVVTAAIAKSDLLQKLKRGLLQDLLTGRVRLPVPKTSSSEDQTALFAEIGEMP